MSEPSHPIPQDAPEQSSSAIQPFLIFPEPEALVQVELVDTPVILPERQFEALLIDSECEV